MQTVSPLHCPRQGIRNLYSGVQKDRIAFYLIEMGAIPAPMIRLYQVGKRLFRSAVPIINPGVYQRIVREWYVRPLTTAGRQSMCQIIARQKTHVLLYLVISGIGI